MERLPVSEQDVIAILRNKEGLIATIQDKIYTIKKDISNTNDIIEMVSLSCKELSDAPSGGGGHSDLWNTYEKYQKQLDVRKREFAEILRIMMLQEEKINRVWCAYLCLDEPYFGILTQLYVQNELFYAVQKESGYSLQVFNKRRSYAVESIIMLYNSDASESKLQLLSKEKKSIPLKKSESQSVTQISLLDYLFGIESAASTESTQRDPSQMRILQDMIKSGYKVYLEGYEVDANSIDFSRYGISFDNDKAEIYLAHLKVQA